VARYAAGSCTGPCSEVVQQGRYQSNRGGDVTPLLAEFDCGDMVAIADVQRRPAERRRRP
jgi:hypothetical protein